MVVFDITITILSIRLLESLKKRVSQLESDINIDTEKEMYTEKELLKANGDIGSDLIKNFQQLRNSDEKHIKLLEMSRNIQRNPMTIMNHNSLNDRFIDTKGDLIPENLTQQELEVLKLYYEKD